MCRLARVKNDVIEDLIRKQREKVARAEKRAHDAQLAVEVERGHLNGLESALAAMTGNLVAPPMKAKSGRGGSRSEERIRRTEAIREVLAQQSPLGPKDIAERVTVAGVEATQAQVTDILRREESLFTKHGYGQWALVDHAIDDGDQDDSAERHSRARRKRRLLTTEEESDGVDTEPF